MYATNGRGVCGVNEILLDGQEFEFYDEVPPRPHPNCKCYIEVIEYENPNSSSQERENEEPCDVLENLEPLILNIEQNIGNTKILLTNVELDIQDIENGVNKVQNLIEETDLQLGSLSEEYGKHLPNCENNVDNNYAYMYARKERLLNLLADIRGFLVPSLTLANTIRVFLSNYVELLWHAYILKQYELDKYYHAKANCEATQEMGIIGEKLATLLSNAKECYDQYTYVHTHKVTIEEAIADSERDQIANRIGRERGRKYPHCSCSELLYDRLPNYKKNTKED